MRGGCVQEPESEDFESALKAFYEKHDPKKLMKVSMFVRSVRFSDACMKLQERYGDNLEDYLPRHQGDNHVQQQQAKAPIGAGNLASELARIGEGGEAGITVYQFESKPLGFQFKVCAKLTSCYVASRVALLPTRSRLGLA